MRSAIALISCAAVLALVAFSIAGKERLLESGKLVYLELAPVDPRSMMQGDYMALRFKIANDAQPAMQRSEPSRAHRFRGQGDFAATDGRIVAALDPRSVATYRRLDDGTPLAQGEILLRYRVREGHVKFATNAFFFQEGTAKRYEGARYGEFRVAPNGELLLTEMRDKELRGLGKAVTSDR
jgi:uncharacterized membrane-anchored protein